jgi:hypothetical protein
MHHHRLTGHIPGRDVVAEAQQAMTGRRGDKHSFPV